MSKNYSRELAELGSAGGSVVSHAGRILADAARLAADYSRDEVAPRARREYAEYIAPIIANSIAAGRRYAKQAPIPVRKKSGLGGFIMAGVAVALVAGVAYVAWQTLRTDDAAWVDDDFDVD